MHLFYHTTDLKILQTPFSETFCDRCSYFFFVSAISKNLSVRKSSFLLFLKNSLLSDTAFHPFAQKKLPRPPDQNPFRLSDRAVISGDAMQFSEKQFP